MRRSRSQVGEEEGGSISCKLLICINSSLSFLFFFFWVFSDKDSFALFLVVVELNDLLEYDLVRYVSLTASVDFNCASSHACIICYICNN